MNLFDLYARKRNWVWPEAGTCRKDAETLVAAKSWRSHCWTPCAANILRENPHNPQMAKAFEAAESVGIAKFRFETDGRMQVLHETTLAWNAEFLVVVAFNPCDDFKRDILHEGSVIPALVPGTSKK